MIVELIYPPQDTSLEQSNGNSSPILILDKLDDEQISIFPKKNIESVRGDSLFYGIENSDQVPIRYIQKNNIEEGEVIIQELYQSEFKIQQVESWQSLMLLLTVLLFGLAKAFSANRFKQTYKSLFNYRVAQEICSEEKVFFHRVNVLLTVIYILVTALLIYEVRMMLNIVGAQELDWSFYPITILFLLAINFGKLIFSKVLSFIYNTPDLVVDYVYTVSLFNGLTGVILIPVLSLMYFTSLDFIFSITYLVLPLLCIVFISRLLRLFVISDSKGVSYFYIFLYICTLEILPLVVMLKFFIFK